jgi:glucose/arabinose dehydrogenase
MSVRALLAMLLVLAASCEERAERRQPPVTRTPREDAPTRAGAVAVARVGVPGQVPTEDLEPREICIRPADLPAPRRDEDPHKQPEIRPRPREAALAVPEGFVIQIFAEDLDEPRWLALTPEGDVLVTETRENRITRLADTDGDGVAERKTVFATEENGLELPFGMAFAEIDGSTRFFLGNHDEVRRYGYPGRAELEGRGEKLADLPGGGYRQHWTRNVVVSPAGDRLFVTVGSRTDHDIEPLPRASVQTMGLDGSDLRTFAHGLRNPVGLAFHPRTRALYATVNERDHLGDDLVPDYLARIEDGAFYGWPYAYIEPSKLDPRQTRGGESVRPDLARRTRTPDVLFQAHSAALGLAFYERGPFPARYHGGAFVAFRGSWNRSKGTGYELVFVPFDDAGRPGDCYEEFVTGFLIDPSVPTTWGRPVGVLILRDGSLLFTDEPGGRIFRVSARG